MAAYPLTEFTPDDDNDQFVVPSGQVLYCQIPVRDGEYVTVQTVHLTPTVQDFTLLCWFSSEPGGTSLDAIHQEATSWHPRRKSLAVNVLYGSDFPPMPRRDVTVYGTQVEPGTYYLNVLNLTNLPNAFYVLVSRVA